MMGTMKSIVPHTPTIPVVRACDACRQRKRKCSGETPCSYCTKKGIVCIFADGKKRGPIPKKQKTLNLEDEVFTNLYSAITNGLQDAMNRLQQQYTLVEFYFHFVGKSVPFECSKPLCSPPHHHSDPLTAQLCIVAAHVMAFFGNHTLEHQYIQEAQKHVNNILNCDTLDSAIALTMMGSYLGERPKGSFYATLAYNIAKLPSVNTNWLAYKIQRASHAMSISLDRSIPHHQRCIHLISQLQDLNALDSTKISVEEQIKVSRCRLSAMILLVLKMDLEDTPQLLSSFTSPPISTEDREYVLEEIKRLDEIQKRLEFGNPGKILALFTIYLMSFLVYWRSGESVEAFNAAKATFEFYKANCNVVTLWLNNALPQLLLLPCYFELCNAKELSKEYLLLVSNAFAKIGNHEELQRLCGDLKLDLTYNIAQIEQELLCDFSTQDVLLDTQNFEAIFNVV